MPISHWLGALALIFSTAAMAGEITPQTVQRLDRVWVSSGDVAPQGPPLVAGDRLAICTQGASVIALDARTGAESWRHDPGASATRPDCGGMAVWTDPIAAPDAHCATRVLALPGAELIALDSAAGTPCEGFVSGDLAEGAQLVAALRGVAVVASGASMLQGYDAASGALLWERALPALDLSVLASDDALGLLLLPVGTSGEDSALVALDARSGEERWRFATPLAEELSGPPVVFDYTGQTALLLAGKSGAVLFLYLESAAASPVETGALTLPGPSLSEKEMWGLTPLDQLWCRIRFRQAVEAGEVTRISGTRGPVAVDPGRSVMIQSFGLAPERAGLTGLPCTRPPHGRLAAVDFRTGQPIWDVALDRAPSDLPALLRSVVVVSDSGGLLASGDGLIFAGAGRTIRALDTETGDTLWSDEPGAALGAPITYTLEDVAYVLAPTSAGLVAYAVAPE